MLWGREKSYPCQEVNPSHPVQSPALYQLLLYIYRCLTTYWSLCVMPWTGLEHISSGDDLSNITRLLYCISGHERPKHIYHMKCLLSFSLCLSWNKNAAVWLYSCYCQMNLQVQWCVHPAACRSLYLPGPSQIHLYHCWSWLCCSQQKEICRPYTQLPKMWISIQNTTYCSLS